MANVNKAQNQQLRPSKSTKGLRISLLGPVTVEIDGAPVAIPSKKARALLGYLVQRSGTDVARSTITGLLWGERGEEQARASLRQTLSELRAALATAEKHPIDANNETIAWVAESAWIDSQELEKAAQSDDGRELREAALLVRGEFMEGLSIEEAAFEHWLAGERERLRQLAGAVYTRLMERTEASGDIESALNHGLKLIALDPLQEQVHRSLMRLYSAQGRNDAALAQYERCKQELLSQLGVQPEAETEALARSIKSGRRQSLANIEGPKPTAPALPDKPSIAVLPFNNLSSDKEQEFFADGVTEDIIGALSRIQRLFVISRSSSFTYKGRAIRAEDVAGELGVRYILEGSVRVAGDRVRVSAQLIDGLSGGHVWAERYEGDINDIFAVQDEITRSIALAMQVTLTHGESARLWEGQTKNLAAWENMVLAQELYRRFSPAHNVMVRQLLEKALLIDPAYTGAVALLGLSHYWDARYDVSGNKSESVRLAETYVEKILALNPEMSSAFTLRAAIAYTCDQFDEAVRLAERAVELAPSDSVALGFLGMYHLHAGNADKASIAIKAARRHNPQAENWLFYYDCIIELWRGNFDTALDSAKLYLSQEPDEPYCNAYIAVIYGFQGQMDSAARTVALIRKKAPAFSIKNIVHSQRYKDREKLDRIVNVLRDAGLPE
jgi:TolB-like protein/two-component SAPR family response regulator